MFRYRPRRKEDIPSYNMKLKETGLIIDKYANQSIQHEHKVYTTYKLDGSIIGCERGLYKCVDMVAHKKWIIYKNYPPIIYFY